MKLIMTLTAIAIVAAGFLLSPNHALAQTSTDRQQRIKEHQEHIRDILEKSQARRRATQPSRIELQAAAKQSTSSTQTQSSNDNYADANWQKFWDFYYKPENSRKEVKFGGPEQEYSDSAVHLRWQLGDDNESDENDKTDSTVKRQLFYKWTGMPGELPVTLDIPKGHGTIYLRNGAECVEFEFASDAAVVVRWRQPADMKIASDVTAPEHGGRHRQSTSSYDILTTLDEPQMVNDWLFYLEDEVVYARNAGTSKPLIVGSSLNNFRPVGTMVAAIAGIDTVTNSAILEISDARYQHTVFATDWENSKKQILNTVDAGHRNIATVLTRLAQIYGFTIKWADDETKQVAYERPFEWTLLSGAILYDITEALGRDFVAEVLTSTSLRVGLSDRYRASQEIPKLREHLDADFKFETKLYSTERLTAGTAAKLMKDMLSCYVIMKPSDTDTSDSLLVKGTYLSILKRPLIEQSTLQRDFEHVRCESIIADAENNTLVVKATAESHAKIAAWLQEIDGTAKKTSLGANEPAPERRRLQVVLLQGGKLGESAAGTSATYTADVPAHYGMTPEDLKVLGFDGAVELGRGLVDLVANPGELGQSTLTLGSRYPITLTYRDERAPYLIVEAKLMGDGSEALAENTMMLEKGKPGFLGVTNLSGAVIVVLTWLGE